MTLRPLEPFHPTLGDDNPLVTMRLRDMPKGFHMTDIVIDETLHPLTYTMKDRLLSLSEKYYRNFEVNAETPQDFLENIQTTFDVNADVFERMLKDFPFLSELMIGQKTTRTTTQSDSKNRTTNGTKKDEQITSGNSINDLKKVLTNTSEKTNTSDESIAKTETGKNSIDYSSMENEIEDNVINESNDNSQRTLKTTVGNKSQTKNGISENSLNEIENGKTNTRENQNVIEENLKSITSIGNSNENNDTETNRLNTELEHKGSKIDGTDKKFGTSTTSMSLDSVNEETNESGTSKLGTTINNDKEISSSDKNIDNIGTTVKVNENKVVENESESGTLIVDEKKVENENIKDVGITATTGITDTSNSNTKDITDNGSSVVNSGTITNINGSERVTGSAGKENNDVESSSANRKNSTSSTINSNESQNGSVSDNEKIERNLTNGRNEKSNTDGNSLTKQSLIDVSLDVLNDEPHAVTKNDVTESKSSNMDVNGNEHETTTDGKNSASYNNKKTSGSTSDNVSESTDNVINRVNKQTESNNSTKTSDDYKNEVGNKVEENNKTSTESGSGSSYESVNKNESVDKNENRTNQLDNDRTENRNNVSDKSNVSKFNENVLENDSSKEHGSNTVNKNGETVENENINLNESKNKVQKDNKNENVIQDENKINTSNTIEDKDSSINENLKTVGNVSKKDNRTDNESANNSSEKSIDNESQSTNNKATTGYENNRTTEHEDSNSTDSMNVSDSGSKSSKNVSNATKNVSDSTESSDENVSSQFKQGTVKDSITGSEDESTVENYSNNQIRNNIHTDDGNLNEKFDSTISDTKIIDRFQNEQPIEIFTKFFEKYPNLVKIFIDYFKNDFLIYDAGWF